MSSWPGSVTATRRGGQAAPGRGRQHRPEKRRSRRRGSGVDFQCHPTGGVHPRSHRPGECRRREFGIRCERHPEAQRRAAFRPVFGPIRVQIALQDLVQTAKKCLICRDIWELDALFDRMASSRRPARSGRPGRHGILPLSAPLKPYPIPYANCPEGMGRHGSRAR